MIETTNATHDVPAAAQPTIIVGADLPRVSAVDAARTIASGGTATLATLTADPQDSLGSLVSYAVDATGNPLFFISELAEHTRNLRADSRASLLATEPQPGTDGLATFADVVDRAELGDALDNGDTLTVSRRPTMRSERSRRTSLTSVLDDPDLVAAIVAYHVVASDADLDDRAEVGDGLCRDRDRQRDDHRRRQGPDATHRRSGARLVIVHAGQLGAGIRTRRAGRRHRLPDRRRLLTRVRRAGAVHRRRRRVARHDRELSGRRRSRPRYLRQWSPTSRSTATRRRSATSSTSTASRRPTASWRGP